MAGGEAWQIITTDNDVPALLLLPSLHDRWGEAGLVEDGMFAPLDVDGAALRVLGGKRGHLISSVQQGPWPNTSVEAQAFAIALREARKALGDMPLHDAIYVEQWSLLLPTYSDEEPFDDATVLGMWLSAGVRIPASSFERLCALMTWMDPHSVRAIVRDAGLPCDVELTDEASISVAKPSGEMAEGPFSLPGRPELEAFFNEHVIEIVRDEERYRRMGIDFPSAVVLHGPPGCGKTFAVERLVEHLGWPCYAIDSGSVGSPYIHDTSRKVAKLFEDAMDAAPSVIVIDEMEAFLSDRGAHGVGLHHVEEVGEFLRRIPEATKRRVLVIAMTNMIDAIDPAILRRGRFDHVIEVEMPSTLEVRALLASLLSGLPVAEDVDLDDISARLAGHPLSDAAFVVKEAGRLAARESKGAIDAKTMEAAHASLSRTGDGARPVGFR